MDNERIAKLETHVQLMREDVSEIKSDVKKMLEFKWKLIGMSVLGAFAATILVEVFRK